MQQFNEHIVQWHQTDPDPVPDRTALETKTGFVILLEK